MKKSLIITFVLGVAMLVFCVLNGMQIYQTKNDIRYMEEVLYGDMEAVKGIQFEIPNQFGSMVWLTQGCVDESLKCKTSTMSVYDMRQLENLGIEEDEITEIVVYRPGRVSFTCNIDEYMYQSPAYEKMLKEQAEDVDVGESKEFELKLSDYSEYYDLTTKIEGMDDYISSGWKEELASLFQVEVGDDVIIKGKITGCYTKSMEGNIKAHEYEYEVIGGIYPYVHGVCFENAGYFYWDIRDKDGNRLKESKFQPRICKLDWKMEKMNALDAKIIVFTDFELKEASLPIDGNGLEICKSDELLILAEENNELFIYSMNPISETNEKQKLCEVNSQVLGVQMEGSKEGLFLMVDTAEEKKIYFLQRKSGQWMPYISVDSKEVECLKLLDSYKKSYEVPHSPEEADYSKIAYAYQDGKLVMLWRQDVNDYNLLVLSQGGVEYASILHSNFKEGLDKENVEPIKIWFE